MELPGTAFQIPTPGDAHIHINFYVAVGSAPTQSAGREIVIGSFQYSPIGSQIAFGRTGDSMSFQSASNAVQINGGPGC